MDSNARIIMNSCYEDKIAEAIELGAQEFVIKPFESAQLLGAIEKIMC